MYRKKLTALKGSFKTPLYRKTHFVACIAVMLLYAVSFINSDSLTITEAMSSKISDGAVRVQDGRHASNGRSFFW